jgi:DNA polymerase-3 subunit alpha
MINRIKKTVTKQGRSAGQQMAMITLEDLDGQVDGVLFAETFAQVNEKYPNAIAAESIVFLKGKVDRRRETPSIIVSEVIPIDEAVSKLTTSLVIKLDRTRHKPDVVGQIRQLLGKYTGRTPVFATVSVEPGRSVVMSLGSATSIKPGRQIVDDLELLLGNGGVQLVGAGTKRAKKRATQQTLYGEMPEAMVEPAQAELAAAPHESDMDE